MSSALTPGRAVRAGGALVLANARYWTSVAPLVRAQLSRWEARAGAIPDPARRALARGKMNEERFNIEVAATLATLAPRARRGRTVEAIVALQVAYDYFDVLTEQAPEHPLRIGDGDYLRELAATVGQALAALPGRDAVAQTAIRCAHRCLQAQLRGHEAARTNVCELRHWAEREAASVPDGAEYAGLGWRELLAGEQASVLALHALIAAAADERTTPEQAERIDAAYLRIAALTMLDGLIDREQDLATGQLDYAQLYDSLEQMAERLASVARDAVRRTYALPHAAHHTMTLAGVVAYYVSAPGASSPDARVVMARLRRELGALIAPTLAVMHVWRMAKSLRRAHSEWG